MKRTNYRLTEEWHPDKPDRRIKTAGMHSFFLKDTRFTITEEEESTRVLKLYAPFIVSGYRPIAEHYGVGTWVDSAPPDVLRLIRALEPDHSEETWLDHQLGAYAYSADASRAVLAKLLTSGAVTREQIVAAADAVMNEEFEEEEFEA